MAQGYLVTLGDSGLDPGDVISGALIDFDVEANLGPGSWTWTGTLAGTGFTFTNVTDNGTYYLSTDGNVYFTPNNWFADPISSASATTTPAYESIIFGTAGDDAALDGTNLGETLFGGPDTDPTGTGNDTIDAGAGDDTIFAGDGNDNIKGGAGSDSIQGGDGDDTIEGGTTTVAATGSESLNWSTFGNFASLNNGGTQDTGGMSVAIDWTDDGAGFSASVRTDTQYVGGGEPMATNSSLRLAGFGSGDNSTVTIDFTADEGSGLANDVENVIFRLNDVDTGPFIDAITVTAFDSAGNPVDVVLAASGDDVVTGDTVTAATGTDDPADAQGSVLVTIAGPVSRIVIDYDNNGSGTQYLYLTDVHFETLAASELDGDDTIDGGAGDDHLFGLAGDDCLIGGEGADTLEGGDGNDTLVASEGDSVLGGDGDDLIVVENLGEGGVGVVTVSGGARGNDTLMLGENADLSSIVFAPGSESEGSPDRAGTVTLDDGSILTFQGIENIICFTTGTRIATPAGARPVEDLAPGDLVLTRDNGLQPIRWAGQRTVAARGKFAPVRFKPGVLTGAERDLVVSPQHRMLFRGHRAELLFGEREVLVPAISLIDGQQVLRDHGGTVTYHHLLFDRHEIIYANGAASESFHPGQIGLEAIDDPAREELFALFPELRSDPKGYGQAARRCLKAREAVLLEFPTA